MLTRPEEMFLWMRSRFQTEASQRESGHPNELDGNVIRGAPILRHRNHCLACFLQAIACECATNLVIAQQTPEPICAEHEHITFAQCNGLLRNVRQGFNTNSERGSQDMSLRVSFGLFRADHAVFNQAANIGVVVRQAGKS